MKNHIINTEGTITKYNTMADGSIRVTLDFGEVSPEFVSELHGLKNKGIVRIILAEEEILNSLNNKNKDKDE